MKTFEKYPCTITLLCILLVLVSMVWLWTHEACTHPLENLTAFTLMLTIPVTWAHWATD